MNWFKNNLFVFAAWLAAKAIAMRVEQMKQEGIFIGPELPISDYAKEIFDVDFGECVWEFLPK